MAVVIITAHLGGEKVQRRSWLPINERKRHSSRIPYRRFKGFNACTKERMGLNIKPSFLTV